MHPLSIKPANVLPNAESFDLLLYDAALVDSRRLLPLERWTRSGRPCNAYTSPNKPTYQLTFDWKKGEDEGPIFVINAAMEICFGPRGGSGWEIWIKGQQLNLILRDFREEYVRLLNGGKAREELALLDLWIDNLREELDRM
jgi:hypothetical protein